MGEKRNAYSYRILVGKPEGKRPLGRPGRRYMDNIKIELREIGWGGIYWIDLTENKKNWRTFLNIVMNLSVPQNAGKFLSSCTTGSFSRIAELHYS
jgi:hypothetical protein